MYLILDVMAQGFTPEEMRQDYGVTPEHVHIALRFAAEYLKHGGSQSASMAVPA